MDYKSAGVDIKAGEQAVLSIKAKAKSTYNKNVLSELGSFGGLYELDRAAWQNPVLVSSTDGVGTKLRVAIMAGCYGSLGQDLVNHCVNDILAQGAIPQFFLDYIGCAKLNPEQISQIIDGMAKACRENECALIGGEMAEMPGIYQDGDFDLVGTIVGMVEKTQILPRNNLGAEDVLIAMPSTGLHTNGYSLARKVVFEKLGLDTDSYVPECQATVAELLLRIHRSYLNTFKPYLSHPGLHGLAHITGGGIEGNLKRIIPAGLVAVVQSSKIPRMDLFAWLREAGNLDEATMRSAFNLGIGMIAVVNQELASQICELEESIVLGRIEPSTNGISGVCFAD
ncbi:MAG: phosphoribosylformylglycinamidine cyclo-ligase [Candidatus Cloacimonetes bacterium]|nr:phosphoribosylformylglycinamidine cyclo-ligase [Candidatus Cloacimonadota bacterium]